ncbi:MAG: 50S ribosomal protein L4, partial [bacterium]|nr:50S ribosomal protein L4 [bacterium]
LILPEFKTRVLEEVLNKLPGAGKDTLIIVEEKNTGIGVAANNVSNATVLPAHCLNVVDLIKARRIIASKEAIEIIESLYIKKK